jgi:SpoVK/Ycf46/Vps4 family AAA+-type ATPase
MLVVLSVRTDEVDVVEPTVHVGADFFAGHRDYRHCQCVQVWRLADEDGLTDGSNGEKEYLGLARLRLCLKIDSVDECTIDWVGPLPCPPTALRVVDVVPVPSASLKVWGVVSISIVDRSRLSETFDFPGHAHSLLCDKIVRVNSTWKMKSGCSFTCTDAFSSDEHVREAIFVASTLVQMADPEEGECGYESLLSFEETMRSYGHVPETEIVQAWFNDSLRESPRARSPLLLTGLSGSGHADLLKYFAHLNRLETFVIDMFSLSDPVFEGQMDRAFRSIFSKAMKRAQVVAAMSRDGGGGDATRRGCFVLLEELDLLLPQIDTAGGRVRHDHVLMQDRLFALQELKRQIEYIARCPADVPIIVGATGTSKTQLAADAVQLFHHHVHLALPSLSQRTLMVQHSFYAVQQQGYTFEPDARVGEYIVDVSKRCNGFVRGDILSLAGHLILAGALHPAGRLSKTHVEAALARAGATGANRTVGVGEEQRLSTNHDKEKSSEPKISKEWDSIGGLEDAKAVLEEAIVWPYLYPEKFKAAGVKPPRGILMYGPPGTGKTLIAKAVASYAGTAFIAASITSLMKGDVGASEEAIVNLFQQARDKSPCVIFLDEIQAIFGDRATSGRLGSSMIAQLMMEMDSLTPTFGDRESDMMAGRVVVLAATNRLDLIDPALLRPGRFDKIVEIGLPGQMARLDILSTYAAEVVWSPTVLEGTRLFDLLREMSEQTDGFSGAALYNLFQRATIHALSKYGDDIKEEDVVYGLSEDDMREALRSINHAVV